MATIQTEGLTKGYGQDVSASNDLSLPVEPGEVFGFLGPSGAGKSTTNVVLLDYHSQPGAGPSAVCPQLTARHNR
ncbi:ATP-binding cassette domain-containing protein (plasmid) [Halobellus limi]|uniref:ABC transporter n=1 Tax=Halobellus limi TaxID=699433 RepID=A0A1H6CG09_9EURY|nr:ATP-binding cassette domain-containing protein [Halobellus limi]QCC49551.1 ATP-binding cassette domain-containing protein [Halobellus limi]SEG71812.1 ABC transporter [Halobellus limi]